MAQTLLNFNQSAKQIESTILQAISENESALIQLMQLVEPTPVHVIQTLETMDAKLGAACASIQHLFNVLPTQEVINGYMAAAPQLSEYANKITQNSWLKNYIECNLTNDLCLEHKKVFTQYQQMMQVAGSNLNVKGQAQLAQYNVKLNEACELFEQNIQTKHDNTSAIIAILHARLKIARLFGHESYWDYSLTTKALNDTDKVAEFIDDVLQRCIPIAKNVVQEIKTTLNLQQEIQPKNLEEYLYKAIDKKYNLNFNEVKEYYPIHAVLVGLMQLAQTLFGICIQRVTQAAWHADVVVFEVTQQNNVIGYIYADLLARDNKRGSSWVDTAQVRRKITSADYQVPIVFLNCNFTPPANGMPCLLSQTDLITLLHEFGHSLHYLLSESDFAALSGVNGVALDEIEIPSMFFENFAFDKQFLDLAARHYQTGVVMPDDLLLKIKAAYQWIAPIKLVQRLKMALLDFKVHRIKHEIHQSELMSIVNEVNQQTNIFTDNNEHTDWHKSASLIFTSQYAAGYYGYLWSEAVAADFYSNLFNGASYDANKAEIFKRNVLAVGGLFDLEIASNNICHRTVNLAAFFHNRNIN